jgi:3-oxoacyl-[acyl-carrier-protein] synthase II
MKESAMAAAQTENGRATVVVTGMGIITSLGVGKQENWTKLVRGESGIHSIGRFPHNGLKTTIAGTVDFIEVEPFCSTELGERMAERVIEEALTEAGIGRKADFPGPLFLAVAPVEIEWPHREAFAAAAGANAPLVYDDLLRATASGRFRGVHERCLLGSVADRLADRFGTKGSPISVSTACASGASAIQLGVEAIRRGEADAALCVGTDGSVNPESLIRFSLLSALSTANDPPQEAAKPFSKNRDGFVMAEGAAAVVLESLQAARARGAKILGVVAGCGEMADAFHRTRSSPDGKAIIGCIRNALADARLSPEDIDYVNPHGTGTPENDKMEFLGISTVFGERAKTIQHQRVPPTINYKIPDPAIPLDVVPNTARDATVRHALSNSFGFGGQNVSLVLSGEPT